MTFCAVPSIRRAPKRFGKVVGMRILEHYLVKPPGSKRRRPPLRLEIEYSPHQNPRPGRDSQPLGHETHCQMSVISASEGMMTNTYFVSTSERREKTILFPEPVGTETTVIRSFRILLNAWICHSLRVVSFWQQRAAILFSSTAGSSVASSIASIVR